MPLKVKRSFFTVSTTYIDAGMHLSFCVNTN